MIRLRLVTPYADGFDREVDRVIVRGLEGDMMLMKGTAPIVTPLAYDAMRIFSEGEEETAVVHGGYVSMKDDVCTVATTAFEWVGEIDVSRAEEAKDRAESQLQKLDDDKQDEVSEAKLALLRALNRLKHASYQ